MVDGAYLYRKGWRLAEPGVLTPGGTHLYDSSATFYTPGTGRVDVVRLSTDKMHQMIAEYQRFRSLQPWN